MEISVTDFSAPIGASVFKFCVHLQVGKVYCENENKDANPYFAFFFQFFIFSFCRSYIIHMDICFVKDFSATTPLMILKFGTKLDSDKVYCVTKKTTYCISVPLLIHFSFSPMEISVTDFSAPIGASVFKLCVHLQVGKMYCVNEN